MKLTLKQGNNILGITGIIGGIIIIALAFIQKLPFMRKGLPGSGFFPVWCGVAITIFGLLIILENYKKSKEAKESDDEDNELNKSIINMKELRTFAYTIGVSILVLISTPIIGMLTSIGLAVICLVKILAEESIKKSILIGVGTSLVLYLIFIVFLGMPLPSSFIGI